MSHLFAFYREDIADLQETADRTFEGVEELKVMLQSVSYFSHIIHLNKTEKSFSPNRLRNK